MRSNLIATRRLLALAALCGSLGCASLSNPTTFPSVAVRRLPPEVFGPSRDAQMDIHQTLLRQPPNQEHKIEAGDTLGIFLPDPFEARTTFPLVTLPREGALSQNIGVGVPVQVLEDGTITLPNLEPLNVTGLTIAQAREKIIETLLKTAIFNTRNQIKLNVRRRAETSGDPSPRGAC